MSALKQPPYSLEAEQSVLGGLILDNQAWAQIADRIAEQDFYREDHRAIFQAISTLLEQGQPCDLVTLTDWFKARGSLDDIGGVACLASLANDTPSAANIKAYADIVRERAVLRDLIRAGTEITEMSFSPEGMDSKAVLDKAEQLVFRIAERGGRANSGLVNINQAMAAAVERIDMLIKQDKEFSGIPTGIKTFDKMTSGLQDSDLIILAGRPAMGKTSFAMNIVENAALKHKIPVAVFSLEMSGEQIALRLVSSLGRLDQTRLRNGDLTDQDWARISSTVGILSEAKIFIDETGALSPNEIRARARRLKREHDIGLIVVDYLQLMQVHGSSENRTNEVSEISRSLKALAKELSVPVIVLSQLNRGVEQRDNKRPRMSDLRESGSIEQDADIVVFLYRDEYYNEESQDKGVAEIIIGKHRNGPTGTARAAFLGQYTRFDNLAEGMYSQEQEYA